MTYDIDTPVNQEVLGAVRRVLSDRLGRYGFKEAKVSAGHDHDGDPVLFIDAYYDPVEDPIDPRVTFGLLHVLREALEAVGEKRFPHVRHILPEGMRVAGST